LAGADAAVLFALASSSEDEDGAPAAAPRLGLAAADVAIEGVLLIKTLVMKHMKRKVLQLRAGGDFYVKGRSGGGFLLFDRKATGVAADPAAGGGDAARVDVVCGPDPAFVPLVAGMAPFSRVPDGRVVDGALAKGQLGFRTRQSLFVFPLDASSEARSAWAAALVACGYTHITPRAFD
jgi:hypothetical protein